MRQEFREIRLSPSNQVKLQVINDIIVDYQNDGYTLTLRQLYYQLVSRDLIPNEDKEYKKLSRLLTEGRMGGIVDWNAIEDRLRKVSKVGTWDNPKSILYSAIKQYAVDQLQDQDTYLEVWVEKDALSQVVKRAAHKYQVPVLVNRGYGSVTAMYDTYERIQEKLWGKYTQKALILYLGDHDPSGLDMVRDVRSRVGEMLVHDGLEHRFDVKHIALTMDQIRTYNPPPNPAKVTDSRAGDYIKNHGNKSWEVDALPPEVLNELIINHLEYYLDIDKIEHWRDMQESERNQMRTMIDNFDKNGSDEEE